MFSRQERHPESGLTAKLASLTFASHIELSDTVESEPNRLTPPRARRPVRLPHSAQIGFF
jgi:hypothetical protein